MAIAKANRFIGAALGAGLSLTTAAFPAAAQDTTPAAMPLETVDTILCETDETYYAHNNWTPETADLDCAADGAREYSESTPGVGILIHVGQDLEQKGVSPEALGQKLAEIFEEKYGVDAQFFVRQNDVFPTGVTYHIGDLIHGADNGTEVKGLRDAVNAMPEVSGLLRIVWEDKLAANAIEAEPTPIPGG